MRSTTWGRAMGEVMRMIVAIIIALAMTTLATES